MRLLSVLAAILFVTPTIACAQAPSPGYSIELAREHYAAQRFDEAQRVLREARERYPDLTVLRRWSRRLDEEITSGLPDPELRLVRPRALPPPTPGSARDQALSPAHQRQTAAYALYAVAIPMVLVSLLLPLAAVMVTNAGPLGPSLGGSSDTDNTTACGFGFLGGLVLGGVLLGIAAHLDSEADGRAAEINRTLALSVQPMEDGAIVSAIGRF